jgi:hypothetical protein
MKTILYTVCFLVFTSSWGQLFVPQPKDVTEKFFPNPDVEIKTPAFLKQKGFTNYEEMMAFIKPLVNQNQDIAKLSYIGESQKGLKVPIINLSKGNASNKIKVWIQAGIHGDEPASTEGVLHLLHQMLSEGKHLELLNSLEIAVVPMANVDGMNRQLRVAVNGLDLNRDQTKLNAKESIFLKQSFSDFNADVALDFHEYRAYRRDFVDYGGYGITNPYDVMFLFSGNLNVPKNLRDFTENKFVNPTKDFLESKDLRSFNYFSTGEYKGQDCFNMGSVNARSSATSYALTNAISTLIEVRGVALGRTSFKRRTMTTYWVAESYLKKAVELKDEIKSQIQTATQSKQDAAVISKRSTSKYEMKMIDLAKNEIITEEVILRNALESIPILTRERPTAYILLPSEKELVKRLKILGLEVEELTEELELEVESYKVTEYLRDLNKYEGVKRQDVMTEIQTLVKNFPKGSYVVNLDQRKSNIAIATLEPETRNSFVSFRVINTSLGETLPYYRYLKSKNDLK